MSEYSPTFQPHDRPLDDELLDVHRDLQLQRRVNNSLDDAETIATLGFGGHETPLYELSQEQLDAKEAHDAEFLSRQWTSRKFGATALMEVADLSHLIAVQQREMQLNERSAALGYRHDYDLTA